MSALCCSRTSHTSRWPAALARINGVNPTHHRTGNESNHYTSQDRKDRTEVKSTQHSRRLYMARIDNVREISECTGCGYKKTPHHENTEICEYVHCKLCWLILHVKWVHKQRAIRNFATEQTLILLKTPNSDCNVIWEPCSMTFHILYHHSAYTPSQGLYSLLHLPITLQTGAVMTALFQLLLLGKFC